MAEDKRSWTVRWPRLIALLGAFLVVAVAVETPTIAKAIATHRGSRPAASADARREIAVNFSWSPGDDPDLPNFPQPDLTYRSATSGPELAIELLKWPVPDPFVYAGVGTDQTITVRPGTPIAVTGDVERVQVYFVTSRFGTGTPLARVELKDGVGALPALHGTYTMVILGRWSPGLVGFTQTVRFKSG
jgi:hypothetical protein